MFNVKEHVEETLGSVQGIWHEYLEIDDLEYWNIEKDIAHEIIYETNPLPSG